MAIYNLNNSYKEITYLFIDGGYLRKSYCDKLNQWIDNESLDDKSINFDALKNSFQPSKAFYYDCLDSIQRPSESDVDFQQRTKQQEDYFNQIREIRGFHVKLGILAGRGRNRRQKEVDILLTVDMMNFAIRSNMRKVILLSGDRDFKPVVESLVALGIDVEIASDPQSTAKELAWAADFHRQLDFYTFYQWLPKEIQLNCPLPSGISNAEPPSSSQLIKTGLVDSKSVILFKKDNQLTIFIYNYSHNQSLSLSFHDLDKLELYFLLQYGQKIEWHES